MFCWLHLSFIVFSVSTSVSGCQFQINQLPSNAPLLLDLNTKGILYPQPGSSSIQLNTGDVIELACPGSGNIKAGNTDTKRQLVPAICHQGPNFIISGMIVDITTSVVCTKSITSKAKYTGASCWGNGKEIKVGLEIYDGRWIQLMTTCFDDVQKNVLYSHHILTKLIGNAVTGGNAPTWSEDNFYNLGTKVNNIYPKEKQRETINMEVGLPAKDEKYVKKSGDHFIAKGHLAPRKDFMYNAQQLQTFHYINSAPQWQSFNQKNWFYFERNLRQYASNKLVDLEVYTGTYGILTLPHETTKNDVNIYLFDKNSIKALPIPELFWKVVYDPLNEAGIAILGVNNPYQKTVTRSIICNDIADQLTWLTFDRFKLESGYIYACTIDDLRRFIPNLPQLNVQRILN